jgi:hypothetical protein
MTSQVKVSVLSDDDIVAISDTWESGENQRRSLRNGEKVQENE